MVIPSGTNRSVTARAPRLSLSAIRRTYGAVTALDGASLQVAAGEVHALLGENGAGKSTLMKIAFGLDKPDAGTMMIDGDTCTFRSPRDAMHRGIGMVQQHFTLVDAMTVAENVALGSAGSFDLRRTVAEIAEISRASGLPLDASARVGDLTVSAQQRLEIVKALARRSTTLILDEPTAVLSPGESAELLAWTRRFADGGGTVILIAHKLREVLSVADRITVMRRGRTVLTGAAGDMSEGSLAGAMLGASSTHTMSADTGHTRTASAKPSENTPVIRLTGVSVRDSTGVTRLRDATLTVHRGEILGVAAVEGAGHIELLRVMAGRLAPSDGTLVAPTAVGYVPEDRHRHAVVLDATLTENVALRGAASRRGVIAWNAVRDTTTSLMRTRDVRSDNADAVMRTLSGGNQQKLVVGRELLESPAALVVENPTRGLDIRATSQVHAALRAARDDGTAVIVYSSDLDEVLALADRIVVVAGGRVRDVAPDRNSVGRAMLDA